MPDTPKTPRVTGVAWDIVDAASAESFPASDPPGWATGQLYSDASADPAVSHETLPDDLHGNEQDRRAPAASRTR